MLSNTAAIRTYFGKLGLAPEIADIYIALHEHGPQSISQLSRNSKVERTRIYRLIDKLMDSNLIEVETGHKRGIIKAAPIANVRILITQKEQELQSLQDELELIEQVLARNSLSSPATRVQFYKGPDGIRQMLRNELNAKTEIFGYANRILEKAAGKKFMEGWFNRFEEAGLACRLLINDDFIASWKAGRNSIGTDRRVKGIEYRYVEPHVFRLSHLSDVYDDVTAYYQWKDGEVFGVELYNRDIADSQRQFFELLWPKAVNAEGHF